MMSVWLHSSHVTEDLTLQPLRLHKKEENNASIARRLASLRRHARSASYSLNEDAMSSFQIHLDASGLCVRDNHGADRIRLPIMLSQIAGAPRSAQAQNGFGVIAYSGPIIVHAGAHGNGLASEVIDSDMWLMVVHESRSEDSNEGNGASPSVTVRGVMEMLGFHGAIRGESSGLQLAGPTLGYGNFSTVLAFRREGSGISDTSALAGKHISAQVPVDDVLHEISVLMRVRGHPNVAAIQGVIAEETDPGVLEWMLITPLHSEGCVQDLVEREGPFAFAKIVGFMDNLLSAVCHIHSCNIVHCDVTTANVVIDTAGHAVLVGFGIAVDLPHPEIKVLRQGTPGFIAPEMLIAAICTHKADVFSCGVMLYYVFTGSLPFDDCTLNRVLRRNALVDVRFPSADDSNPRSRALGLMRSMLAPVPNQRMGSGDALAMVRSLAQNLS